jgi:hypothetical protein
LSVTANCSSQTFVRSRGEERSVEAIDLELDRLISRRASADLAEDPDTKEELWKASVRAYTGRRQEEMRAAWCEFHQGQAARHRAVLEALIARHEEQAEKYRDQHIGGP